VTSGRRTFSSLWKAVSIHRLITHLYFAGEPENQTDRWLNAAPRPERLIVAIRSPATDIENGALSRISIVLASG
jgi:protocatechuate 3,4-dioxygenase beta subunit